MEEHSSLRAVRVNEVTTLVLKTSRKIFWWAYAGVIILVSLLFNLLIKGMSISRKSLVLSSITIIVGLLLPEIVRAWQVCKISKDKIEIISGIVHRRHRTLLTDSIAEIHMHQTLMQRLLNYGSIYMRTNNREEEMNLGIFNSPKKNAAEIQKIIGLEH